MPNGVCLHDGCTQAPSGRYVHHDHEDWRVTSNIPLDESMFNQPVVDSLLPGAFGRYVYPMDAVFTIKRRNTTTARDLDERIRQMSSIERKDIVVRMNHLTVDLLHCGPPLDEEDEFEEVEECEEEGEDAEEAEDVDHEVEGDEDGRTAAWEEDSDKE